MSQRQVATRNRNSGGFRYKLDDSNLQTMTSFGKLGAPYIDVAPTVN
jgi:hypothetical protein